MLKSLSIRNYALIEKVDIEWNDNLNVITGETGAGKSIVIDALTLILGQRGNKQNIRRGADKMTVQGVFDVSENEPAEKMLSEMAVDVDDGELIITRSIDVRGKNVCRANGFAVTVGQLRSIGELLVDIHSQHENNKIFQNDTQRRLLDAYGGENIASLLKKTAAQSEDLKKLNREIREQERDERELERQKEIYSFELKDIQKAELQPDEDTILEKERRILENGERLFSAAEEAYHALNGDETDDDGILSELSDVRNNISLIAEIDERFEGYPSRLSSAANELNDAAEELRDYLDTLDFDPGRLNAVEKRLTVIDRLCKKYGASVNDVIAYGESIQKKLDALENHDDILREKKKDYKKRWKKYRMTAAELHSQREKAAFNLKREMEKELADLAMPRADFQIVIEEDKNIIAPWGNDRITFMISVNPGIAPQELKKVASGGEISRIMLAVKCIFGELDHIETMIFDEIDTGISGRTAQVVAEKIMTLSRKRQIICITHLPQITAMADRHFRVEKSMDDASVEVEFNTLERDESAEELARMLSGAEITKTSLEHAKELLDSAKREKAQKG